VKIERLVELELKSIVRVLQNLEIANNDDLIEAHLAVLIAQDPEGLLNSLVQHGLKYLFVAIILHQGGQVLEIDVIAIEYLANFGLKLSLESHVGYLIVFKQFNVLSKLNGILVNAQGVLVFVLVNFVQLNTQKVSQFF
jgi:hypothetical protein